MIIIGAGLSGCLAGALDRGARILEAAPALPARHKAVLRFRSDRIGTALGIPFRKVRVYKGVFADGEFRALTPALINAYSRKVLGVIVARSIVSLDTVDRWVGPPDLHSRLAELCAGRIQFDCRVEYLNSQSIVYGSGDDGVTDASGPVSIDRSGVPVVNTAPLPLLLQWLGVKEPEGLSFSRAAIRVQRYRVKGADVHQTIYFPDIEHPVYRATLTGEDLLIESTDKPHDAPEVGLGVVRHAFGLLPGELELIDQGVQPFGKIVELPAAQRKELLLAITLAYQVYNLGRFATWRNVLLDDVAVDFSCIRDMIRMHRYDLLKRTFGE